MTRRRMLLGRLAGVCLAAALCLGAAQGAVYDATTGYVRLLRNGTASVIPLTTNHVAEISGSTTNYLWSDHLAIHAGTNYYANMWFRGWNRNTRDPAVIYPIPCNRFVLDKASINWKCGYPSVIVFENEGLFVLGNAYLTINQDSCVLGGIGGTITVQETSSSRPFTWQTSTAGYATMGHGFYVTAKVVGDADQIMRIITPADQSGRVYFTGDMSDYLGTINTISNIVYAGTSLAAKAVNATSGGEVRTHGADGAEIFIPNVTLDATSAIGGAATNSLVVDTLTMADGSTVRGFFNERGLGGCVTVTNSFTAAGKIRVAVEMPTRAATNDVTRIAVLRVAKSAGTVTQEQLEIGCKSRLADATAEALPNVTAVEVEDEGDWTTVYVTWQPLVCQIVDNSGAANAGKFHLATTWSNNKTPTENAGADFYTDVGCYISIPPGSGGYYHFPGRSFAVMKTITLSSIGTYEFDELNIYTGSTAVQTMRAWVNGRMIIRGALNLIGANPYLFTFGNNTTQRWESAISGQCNIIAGIRRPDANAKELCSEFEPANINTNFTGKWIVQHNAPEIANPTQFMIFAVCESRNLGKPFPTFQYDALTIKNWQALKPGGAESVLDDMTRGVNFEGAITQVVAPEGRTLALKCPITLSGVLHKSGAGTLALGGTVKPKFCGATQSATPLAGTNGLVVTEGWIKPISTNGVDGLAMEFAGGGIRLDHAPTDAGVAAYGFWNTKWSVPFARAEGVTAKVPVMVDMGDLTGMPEEISRYAICTVAADKAAGVKGMLEVQRPFKGYVTGIEERANADGTTTLLAVIKYGGMTVIIR